VADSPLATQRRLERPTLSRAGGDADVRGASMLDGEMPRPAPLTSWTGLPRTDVQEAKL
jgi:hypothetical protein